MSVVRLSQYRHQLEVEHVQNMCPFFKTINIPCVSHRWHEVEWDRVDHCCLWWLLGWSLNSSPVSGEDQARNTMKLELILQSTNTWVAMVHVVSQGDYWEHLVERLHSLELLCIQNVYLKQLWLLAIVLTHGTILCRTMHIRFTVKLIVNRT